MADHAYHMLVLLCIIIVYTDHTACKPLKRSTTDVAPALNPELADLLQTIADAHESATATASNVLPAIVNLLEEDKILQTSQNQLMATSSATINLSLMELVNLMKTQQNMQQRQTELLENTFSSLQQMTTLLQDIPPPLTNMVQIQQDMQEQLINITQLLQSRDTSLLSDGSNGQLTISPMNIKLTTLQPHEATSLPSHGSLSSSNGQLPSDCSGAPSTGKQTIPLNNDLGLLNVYCDMETDGGGWIVFQRRFNGSVDFYRKWVDYERGFGSLDGEFWIGLNNLHVLTSRGRWEFRIDVTDFNGNHAYAHYDNFEIGNSSSNYRLTVGSYTGTAGDEMTYHNGMPFSTRDQDHDKSLILNCAYTLRSAWWYTDCTYINLNGLYLGPDDNQYTGMTLYGWKELREVLKTSEMKIRLVDDVLQPPKATSLPSHGSLSPSNGQLPSDCSSALSTGQHTIPLYNDLGLLDVYCDMETDGGGWIVFQRRFDGSVDFYREWADYERGFGSLDGEFWLGLSKLHELTSRTWWELRVDMSDFDGNRAYAHYNIFQVSNSSSHYKLTLGSYSGTAGDGMREAHDLNGMAFSTKDKDHDLWHGGIPCAEASHSGWWFKWCTYTNPNGLYLGQNQNDRSGMTWYEWKYSWEVLKTFELKIRLVDKTMQPPTPTPLTSSISPCPNGQQTISPYNASTLPSDCSSAVSTGRQTISPINNEFGLLDVYCDMETDGDGWIVFQRRFDGSVDFYRKWVDYECGFGSLDGEFWLGLNKLHVLTSRGRWELRVDMTDFDGNSAYANYDNFQVGNSLSLYKLTLGSYSGTAEDGMRGIGHTFGVDINGMPFTTRDRDHDELITGNCGHQRRSGWWHKYCTYANIIGLYLGPNEDGTNAMSWKPWKDSWEALKTSQMKIRLVDG